MQNLSFLCGFKFLDDDKKHRYESQNTQIRL